MRRKGIQYNHGNQIESNATRVEAPRQHSHPTTCVIEAESKGSKCKYIIKQIRLNSSLRSTNWNFKKVEDLQEIRILKKLGSHANIVALCEYGCDKIDGSPYALLVFESVGDVSFNLECFLNGGGMGFSRNRREKWAGIACISLLNAAEHLHSNGIVHRNIDPQNMFIKTDFSGLVLGGIGSAYELNKIEEYPHEYPDHPGRMSRNESVFSTHTSPENLLFKECPKAMDLWAIGSVTFQILLGRNQSVFRGTTPFREMNECRMIENIHDILRIERFAGKGNDQDRLEW